MTVGNIKLEHASLWIQIWGALFDMVSPQVAKEVGSHLGIVEEVEWMRRQDDPNFLCESKLHYRLGSPWGKEVLLLGQMVFVFGCHLSMNVYLCFAITVVC